MISKIFALLTVLMAALTFSHSSIASSSLPPSSPPALPPGFATPGPGDPSCGTMGCGPYIAPTSADILITILLDSKVQAQLAPYVIATVSISPDSFSPVLQITTTAKCEIEARLGYSFKDAVIDGIPAAQVGKSSAYAFVDVMSNSCP